MANLTIDQWRLYYHVKRNEIEMMLSRSYTVDQDLKNLLTASLDNFINYYTTLYTTGINNASQKIHSDFFHIFNNVYEDPATNQTVGVLYAAAIVGHEKIRTMSKKSFLDLSNGLTTNKKIIISLLHPDTGVYEYLDDPNNRNVEFFTYEDLYFNPTKHFLVPYHEVLSENEKNKFIYENGIRISTLPVIRRTDPIAKYYGAHVGDIIRIYRTSILPGLFVENSMVHKVVVRGGAVEAKDEEDTVLEDEYELETYGESIPFQGSII